MILDEPAGLHLDSWGVVLLASGLLLGSAGVTLRLGTIRDWAHHPFRLNTQARAANALLGSAMTTVLVGASHLLGWPIYGLPVVGVLALGFSASLIGFLAIDWWTQIRPELERYEARYPGVAVARSDTFNRLELSKSSAPTLWTLGVAAIAYGAFVWHPWPHILHEGNWLYGAPAGFAIGSLVAMRRSAVADRMGPPRRLLKLSSSRGRR